MTKRRDCELGARTIGINLSIMQKTESGKKIGNWENPSGDNAQLSLCMVETQEEKSSTMGENCALIVDENCNLCYFRNWGRWGWIWEELGEGVRKGRS